MEFEQVEAHDYVNFTFALSAGFQTSMQHSSGAYPAVYIPRFRPLQHVNNTAVIRNSIGISAHRKLKHWTMCKLKVITAL